MPSTALLLKKAHARSHPSGFAYASARAKTLRSRQVTRGTMRGHSAEVASRWCRTACDPVCAAPLPVFRVPNHAAHSPSSFVDV